VRSCLGFACQYEGAEIETVESLANGDELHPLQQAFHEHHGLQCGFCTPGFLMAAKSLYERGDELSPEEIREYLAGNICRCTGYAGIVAAVQAAIRAPRGGALI
jgi:carbon-monoxide dehydrogenase small subunit